MKKKKIEKIEETKRIGKIEQDNGKGLFPLLLCRIFRSIGLVSQLLSNLFLELLDGDFSLENPAHTGAPVLLQALHLGFDVGLARRARGIDEINVAFGVGQVALETAQLVLEVVV